MIKFYYDNPTGCDMNGVELWRFVGTKNGDKKNGLSPTEMKHAVENDNFRLISASTDGMASRFKTWASSLRIDKNSKVLLIKIFYKIVFLFHITLTMMLRYPPLFLIRIFTLKLKK